MSTPISSSEKLGYQIRYSIFNCAYKAAKQTNHSRFPAFIALSAYGLTAFAAQIASIAELTFRGFRTVLSSNSPSEKMHGWIMLKRIPEQGVTAVYCILGSLINIVLVVTDPKFYILINTAQARVDFGHLQAGTINSKDHDIDSDEAIGKVKSGEFY